MPYYYKIKSLIIYLLTVRKKYGKKLIQRSQMTHVFHSCNGPGEGGNFMRESLGHERSLGIFFSQLFCLA